MSGTLSLNTTIPADISIYQDLIPGQNQNQPNFMATIAASVQPFADISSVIQSFPVVYDIDEAVGSNLDTVGLWIGVTRFLTEPINAYFSFDTEGLGFNQASWFTTGDATSGIVSLDDETYRLLLLSKVGANHWNGTKEGAYNAWDTLFGAETVTIVAPDSSGVNVPISALANGVQSEITAEIYTSLNNIAIQCLSNMSMIFVLTGNQPNAIISALFQSGEINLNPAGVMVYLALPSVYPGGVTGGTPLFGLDSENSTVSGLDIGALVTVVSNS